MDYVSIESTEKNYELLCKSIEKVRPLIRERKYVEASSIFQMSLFATNYYYWSAVLTRSYAGASFNAAIPILKEALEKGIETEIKRAESLLSTIIAQRNLRKSVGDVWNSD